MKLSRQQPAAPHVTPAARELARQQLLDFLTEQTPALLGTLRSYVQRMGLAQNGEISAVAADVLQEVVVEALEHSERFDPTRQPMAWLLGIALNVIKRKRTEVAKRSQRELSFAHLTVLRSEHQESSAAENLLEQLVSCSIEGPERKLESDEQAQFILSLVSDEDRKVLQLAIVHDFERDVLAQALGITAVAARVRLHRALARLRIAWQALQQQQQVGEQQITSLERKTR
ncbi:RNA polymerase sigma factor [Tengunoibacter tsumagoiensis]|uniref:RNA polymerase sigma-70 region 2 domain-containing protein n=1 Tax=Tengunoibacter tsumagoiensis TaxID=2014871 RepID=A0A402A6H6_9CHLR|nr:sigma-70 family RNA polymerase sigma factor [Tengunoibacter tsumagoiensis]GCE14747.1 hypothetical protein KTT_46060 [Tengunoibacter tsumagoiensis]